jgi:Sigma-70 region 2
MPRIFNLARRMAGPDAAEELTQDVFVRAWQKLALFRGESSFATARPEKGSWRTAKRCSKWRRLSGRSIWT